MFFSVSKSMIFWHPRQSLCRRCCSCLLCQGPAKTCQTVRLVVESRTGEPRAGIGYQITPKLVKLFKIDVILKAMFLDKSICLMTLSSESDVKVPLGSHHFSP